MVASALDYPRAGRQDSQSLLADLSFALGWARTGTVDGSVVEEACRDYLVALRWPDGVECPRCNSRRLSEIPARSRWNCHECRYQFSVRSGTLLHDSHLRLWKWLVAVYLTATAKRGLSAHELHGLLGGSYKSWWFAAHRIRSALENASPAAVPQSDLFAAIAQAVEPRRSRRHARKADQPYHATTPKYHGYYWTEVAWRNRSGDDPGACCSLALALLAGTPLPFDDLVGGASP